MKAKVNSKIAPVERFGISTPARSRGSNRDQEVDPALRFAFCIKIMRFAVSPKLKISAKAESLRLRLIIERVFMAEARVRSWRCP